MTSTADFIKVDVDGADVTLDLNGAGAVEIVAQGKSEAGQIDIATAGGKYVYNSSQDLDSSPKGVKAEGEIIINGVSAKTGELFVITDAEGQHLCYT